MAAAMAIRDVLPDLIAGTLPLVEPQPLNPVLLHLRDLLGTSSIHSLASADRQRKRVHFFAAPSRAFSSTTSRRLPLTVALPGHPSHKGPGCYLMLQAPLAAAAVFDGEKLRLIVNETELVEAAVAELELPVYDVTGQEDGWELASQQLAVQKAGDRLSRSLMRYSGIAATVFAALLLGAAAVNSWVESSRDRQKGYVSAEAMLVDGMKQMTLRSPLSEQITRLQQITAVVVRAGGWIDAYERGGESESYRVILPEWVSRDYLSALDADVRADRRGDGTIAVVKGSPPGNQSAGATPSSAPVQAAPVAGAKDEPVPSLAPR